MPSVIGIREATTDRGSVAVSRTVLSRPPEGSDEGKRARGVSLLMGENLPAIQAAHGLCTERFWANLTTEGLEYSLLHEGTRLAVGTSVIEITRAGKRCFAECPLQQRGETCPLPRSVAFAQVIANGTVAFGDAIELLG